MPRRCAEPGPMLAIPDKARAKERQWGVVGDPPQGLTNRRRRLTTSKPRMMSRPRSRLRTIGDRAGAGAGGGGPFPRRWYSCSGQRSRLGCSSGPIWRRCLERADAIIELAGPAVEGRDQVAIKLAREHKAAFLVQSTVVAEAGTHRCLPAVPGVTVLCFHPVPGTTRGEAEWIGREAEMRHWRSVILVTTPDQAWRARLRVSRCFNGKVYGATSPLPFLNWFEQIPYQWFASAKALTVERAC